MKMNDTLMLMSIISRCETAVKCPGAVIKTGDQHGRDDAEKYTDYELLSPVIEERLSGTLSKWFRIYDDSRLSEIHLFYQYEENLHIIITSEGWHVEPVG